MPKIVSIIGKKSYKIYYACIINSIILRIFAQQNHNDYKYLSI